MGAPTWAKEVSLNFKVEGLKIRGEFALPDDRPLVIEGYDDQGKPYQFRLRSKKKESNSAVLEYRLTRDKKTKSGAITAQVGEVAKLTWTAEQEPSYFEVTWR